MYTEESVPIKTLKLPSYYLLDAKKFLNLEKEFKSNKLELLHDASVLYEKKKSKHEESIESLGMLDQLISNMPYTVIINFTDKEGYAVEQEDQNFYFDIFHFFLQLNFKKSNFLTKRKINCFLKKKFKFYNIKMINSIGFKIIRNAIYRNFKFVKKSKGLCSQNKMIFLIFSVEAVLQSFQN